MSGLTIEEKVEYIKEGQERMLAMQMMINSDHKRFGSVIVNMKNLYMMNKSNNYPQNNPWMFHPVNRLV